MGILAVLDRYARYWVARSLGIARRWVNSDWRPFVVTLAAVVVGVWVVDTVRMLQPSPEPSATVVRTRLLSLATVLGIWAAGALIVWGWRARRRLVIDEFTDHSATADGKSAAKGLSALLVAELGRLRDLYRNVDEERPIVTAVGSTQTLSVSLNVEDVSEYLKSAVSAESTITLGFFSVPVGSILALFGKLVQGPRITGSLYQDGDVRVLVAQIVGGEQGWTWRVEAGPKAGQAPRISEMIAELANAMFTDLTLGGSIRPRAVAAFCDGLSAYRNTLTTKHDKRFNLRRAEWELRRALCIDDRLPLAHYNLAVVFLELDGELPGRGYWAAAARQFIQSIERDPSDWRGFNGLATICYNRARELSGDAAAQLYGRVIALCARATVLAPAPAAAAAAWDLRGRAERFAGRLDDALASRETASRLGWSALCRIESQGQPVSSRALRSVRGLAANCIRNYGIACMYMADQQSNERRRGWLAHATGLVQQAIWVTPADAELYSLLGAVYLKRDRAPDAMTVLSRAAGMAPDNLLYLGQLAHAAAAAGDATRARIACAQALDRASDADETALGEVALAFELLKEDDQSRRVASMKGILDELTDEDDLAELERRLGEYRKSDLDWEAGHCARRMGMLHLGNGEYTKAQQRLEEAVAHFEAGHEGEIRRHGLHTLVARAMRFQGGKAAVEAVKVAAQAAREDPLSVFERTELANCYRAIGDFEAAIAVLDEALLADPNKAELHSARGANHLSLARQRRHRDQRDAALAEARDSYDRALTLYEPGDPGRVAVRYFLGRLHQDLGQFSRAAAELQMAYNLNYSRLTTALYLGQAHQHDRGYDWAAAYFKEVIKDGERAIKDGAKPTAVAANESGDEFLLGSTIAWAYVLLAYGDAVREVNLDQCLHLVGKAREYLAQADDDSDTCKAACACCEGMVFLLQDRADEAVEKLQESVELDGDPEFYHQLARAYERRAETAVDEWTRIEDLRRALRACDRSTAVDFYQEFEAQITLLRAAVTKTLQTAEASVKSPRPAAKGATDGKGKKPGRHSVGTA